MSNLQHIYPNCNTFIYLTVFARTCLRGFREVFPNRGLAGNSKPRRGEGGVIQKRLGQVNNPVCELSAGSLLGPAVKSKGEGRVYCAYTFT